VPDVDALVDAAAAAAAAAAVAAAPGELVVDGLAVDPVVVSRDDGL